jgi:hypothetical protein
MQSFKLIHSIASSLSAGCLSAHPDKNDECEYMKCTYEGMDGERYRCERCGQSYFLDYEDMK